MGTDAGTKTGQSLERALRLMEHLADAGGAARLSDLATASGMPLPSVHRVMKVLVANGYARQQPSKTYVLGSKLIRLGEAANRVFGAWATPLLVQVAAEVGETANMAALEGDAAIYVAQAPSAHLTRMFTEVGRRVPLHSTGVGKALLSQMPDGDVERLLTRTGMPARNEHTLTSVGAMLADLRLTRERGYAVDESEHEIGVRCVAVPVLQAPTLLAISTSGPSGRLTLERIEGIATVLQDAAVRLSARLREAGVAG